MDTLHGRLNMLREQRGVSVREIARLMGDVSANTAAKWFNGTGEPRIGEAKWLAEYFGVSLDWLVGDGADDGQMGKSSIHEQAIVELLSRHGEDGIFRPDSKLPDSERREFDFGQHIIELHREYLSIVIDKMGGGGRRDWREPRDPRPTPPAPTTLHKQPLAILKGGRRPESRDDSAPKDREPVGRK
ncbi:MAG: helix-turn-helix transcriptional regulator [Patescibacteria group bacterium]|nr:helix-turn-helix transcriptional regulator [Patescibacteria group bacterium]